MKRKSNIDFSTNQIEDSSGSPPQERAKRQSEENSSQLEATSISTAKSDDHLSGSEHVKQRSTNSNDTDIKQPLKNGIFNFFLPLEEECIPSPEENLGPNSASLKSSRTGRVWHKSLEESHSAQIKDKSLLWIKNCEGVTSRYRDPMPFWRFWTLSEFPQTNWSFQKWERAYLWDYSPSWVH